MVLLCVVSDKGEEPLGDVTISSISSSNLSTYLSASKQITIKKDYTRDAEVLQIGACDESEFKGVVLTGSCESSAEELASKSLIPIKYAAPRQ
jgi:hypothetical protein